MKTVEMNMMVLMVQEDFVANHVDVQLQQKRLRHAILLRKENINTLPMEHGSVRDVI